MIQENLKIKITNMKENIIKYKERINILTSLVD